jgi:hypothetical protein
MRRGIFVVLPLLVVGIAGALTVVVVRESDAAFVYRQQNPRTVEPTEVELAVMTADEPVAEGKGTAATRATCTPGRRGELRNPWLCRVRYESGRRVGYSLTIAPDGSWNGVNPTGERRVNGCCFSVGE